MNVINYCHIRKHSAVHYRITHFIYISHGQIFLIARDSFLDEFKSHKTIIKLYMHLTSEILMVVSGWIIHYHIRKLAAVNYRFTYIYYLPNGMEFWKTDFRCALVTFSRSQQAFSQFKRMLSYWERVADLIRDSCVEKKKKKKTRPPLERSSSR